MTMKPERLTLEERIRLVEDIWDSIAADQQALPLTAEQRTEIDRRLDAYERDKNTGRTATEAIAETAANYDPGDPAQGRRRTGSPRS